MSATRHGSRRPVRSTSPTSCSDVGRAREARRGDAFRGVTTDSRTIEPGELFVAVRGETHDGHAFLRDALGRGAGGVVGRAGHGVDDLDGTVIVVRETLAALGDLAAAHRRRHPVPLVAVAGSNGKTTTKEMLATILRAAYGEDRVVWTRGSQNNLVGLPLTCCASTTRRGSSCSRSA
jgi:UDP-N-acetylmuramyl pentapeptide synthase